MSWDSGLAGRLLWAYLALRACAEWEMFSDASTSVLHACADVLAGLGAGSGVARIWERSAEREWGGMSGTRLSVQ
eukprot:12447321-Alexandrium_andersonii.AAC.1